MSSPAATTPAASVPWYGNSGNWAEILRGAGEGAGSAMQGAAGYANSKEEAKEAKRRTLGNLLAAARKRDRGLYRVGQDYTDEMNDFQSQALQNIARGFVEALSGSTGRL